MTGEGEDRRTRRTRGLLRHALLGLMLEKRFDAITVQEIVDRADVGRSTFYAHFSDKEDLAANEFRRMFDQLTEHMAAPSERGPVNVSAIFRHVQENHELYRALVRGRALDFFMEKGEEYLRGKIADHLTSSLPQGHEPAVPTPILAAFGAGTLLTLLKWWLDNGMNETPERMDEIFATLVIPSIHEGLGLPAGGH